jgi:hypothetical protein
MSRGQVNRIMRLREWRYLRFGPAVVHDVVDGSTASLHLWADSPGEPIAEGLAPVSLDTLPEQSRRAGGRIWLVQVRLFNGDYRTIDCVPRPEGEGFGHVMSFARQWRRAHRRWWELWKWDVWLPRLP